MATLALPRAVLQSREVLVCLPLGASAGGAGLALDTKDQLHGLLRQVRISA